MILNQRIRSASRGVLYGAGFAAAGYAALSGLTWLRYGRIQPAASEELDALLDYFIPEYDVVERHHTRVAAPADITFEAACDVDFQQSATIQAIFKGRELMLGGGRDAAARPRGLLAFTKSLGWGLLAEIPGREVVLGAVTQPWEANVRFRALPPDEFQAFNEPGFVKIVWTLCADPITAGESVFRTETRVATTDPAARKKFRRYWSIVSPGVVIIRRVALTLVRAEAERRAAAGTAASGDRFDLVSAGDLDPEC